MEPTEIEKTKEQQDIEYLQDQLEQTHYDLYRNVNKQTLSDSLHRATDVNPEFISSI
jgi:hypothetical protein